MIIPGIYRHYKGGWYLGLFVARNSEHRDDQVVVYFSITKFTFWARPYKRPLLEGDDCWVDVVAWPDGERLPRFIYSFANVFLFVMIYLVLFCTVLRIFHLR